MLLAAAGLYAAGGAAYYNFVPDVAQGFTPWHLLGYFMGYENIRQDWKTLHTPGLPCWRYGLAAIDLVWNATLGVAKVYGFLNGALHAIAWAKQLYQAGPASHSMLSTLHITLQESITTRIPFRVPGTKNILVPPGYLDKGRWRAIGALAHEITHVQQEFGALGRVLVPLQWVSVGTTRGVGRLLWFWGYVQNPIEICAAASGVINWVNLAFVTVIQPFISGTQNGLINDYNFLQRIIGQ